MSCLHCKEPFLPLPLSVGFSEGLSRADIAVAEGKLLVGSDQELFRWTFCNIRNFFFFRIVNVCLYFFLLSWCMFWANFSHFDWCKSKVIYTAENGSRILPQWLWHLALKQSPACAAKPRSLSSSLPHQQIFLARMYLYRKVVAIMGLF